MRLQTGISSDSTVSCGNQNTRCHRGDLRTSFPWWWRWGPMAREPLPPICNHRRLRHSFRSCNLRHAHLEHLTRHRTPTPIRLHHQGNEIRPHRTMLLILAHLLLLSKCCCHLWNWNCSTCCLDPRMSHRHVEYSLLPIQPIVDHDICSLVRIVQLSKATGTLDSAKKSRLLHQVTAMGSCVRNRWFPQDTVLPDEIPPRRLFPVCKRMVSSSLQAAASPNERRSVV